MAILVHTKQVSIKDIRERNPETRIFNIPPDNISANQIIEF